MSILSTATAIADQIREYKRLRDEMDSRGKDRAQSKENTILTNTANEEIAGQKIDADATQRDLDRRNQIGTTAIKTVGGVLGSFLGGKAIGDFISKRAAYKDKYGAAEALFKKPSLGQRFIQGTKDFIPKAGKAIKKAATSKPAISLGIGAAASQLLTSTPLNHSSLNRQANYDNMGELARLETELSKGRVRPDRRDEVKHRIDELRSLRDNQPGDASGYYRQQVQNVLSDDAKRTKRKRHFN